MNAMVYYTTLDRLIEHLNEFTILLSIIAICEIMILATIFYYIYKGLKKR